MDTRTDEMETEVQKMDTGTEEIQNDTGTASTPLPAENIGEMVLLDSDGDAIFVVGNPSLDTRVRFRVSTKVLSLASPVFAKMFGPSFQEGQRLRFGETVQVNLEDDDPRSMEVILKALHYYRINQSQHVDAKQLASIAVHCDKYDCTGALSSWIIYWFNKVKSAYGPPETYGFLLLAAYILDDAEQFKEISIGAISGLSLSFPSVWKHHEILSLLPETIQSIIATQIQKTLRQLHIITEAVEGILRQNKLGYEIDRQVCMDCGRTLPNQAKKCRPCDNSELVQRYCTPESRVAEYFEILQKAELWPSVMPFETCSLLQLLTRLDATKILLKYPLRHSCAAGSECPLESELELLPDRGRMVRFSILGLCLRCIKRGEWDGSQGCSCK